MSNPAHARDVPVSQYRALKLEAEKLRAENERLRAVGRELLNAVDAAEFDAEEEDEGRLDRALDAMSKALGPPGSSPSESEAKEP